MRKFPKKYSLKWWYQTGAIFRAEACGEKRVAKGLISHLCFKLGYKFGIWNPAPEGDFERVMTARGFNR